MSNFVAQYKIEDLYKGVAKKKKVYNPDGSFVVENVDNKSGIVTGIKVFDDFIELLNGKYNEADDYCNIIGVEPAVFSGFVFMLTGFNATNFKLEYKKLVVKDYLTFCNKNYNVAKLAEKVGCTPHHLEYLCRKWFNMSVKSAKKYFSEKNTQKNVFIE